MKSKLVIVESPTKARTITRFLDSGTRVMASMGHVRDLPENSLGVDLKQQFRPVYVMTRNGKKVMDELKKAALNASDVYLATDPDREGEAIAWHIHQVLHPFANVPFHRISFHEITRDAIRHAISDPGAVNQNLVDSQQARRVLDRIVGYQVSPMLWKHIKKGTSAGRVQSVALRLICERERAVQAFVPVEYWNLDATFEAGATPEAFHARLVQLDGEKPQVGNEAAAAALVTELEQAAFRIARVAKNTKYQRPAPPFITSTLQQASSYAVHMGAGQTMRVAQELYEGLELGSEGAVGLITYMRTDAVDVAKEAQGAARQYITRAFGPEYVPPTPNIYKSRQSAQAAHEAIRPTDVSRTPDSIAKYLTPPQLKLYRLIWNRFVASQMTPAQMLEHVVEVAAEGRALTHAYLFRATATSPVFLGYLRVYNVEEADQDELDGKAKEKKGLPETAEGADAKLLELGKEQCFTEPPRRYSEATLVKELEQNGIGRPSTYASIVETIQDRDYVKKEKGRLIPTALGFSVNDYLVQNLGNLFQVSFTAQMEAKLDAIEEGKQNWVDMLQEFYQQFCSWSGAMSPVAAPKQTQVAEFLRMFPASLPWGAPVRRAGRTFDDRKFHESLCQQAEGEKPVTDKQWQAILVLGARYADHIPGLAQKAEELGCAAELESLIRREKTNEAAHAAAAAAGPTPPTPEVEALLEVLEHVEWESPSKRGGKTFNDKKFYQSLARQARTEKSLTDPQINVLKRLVIKYRAQIPTYEELAKTYSLEAPQPQASGDGKPVAPLLVEMICSVTRWEPAAHRGSRTFDDQKFANSLKDQYEKRRMLSPKQIEAVVSMLARYRDQIPDFEARCTELGLKVPTAPPPPPDAQCPQCGSPLVLRRGRGKPFYGCSGYPQCRYIAPELPQPASLKPAAAE